MVFLLLIILFVLVLISYFANNEEVISPAFLFSLSFFIAAIFVAAYSKKWLLNLQVNTFLVITIGVFWFFLVCFIVKSIFYKTYTRTLKNKWIPRIICIQNYKLIIFIMIEIVTIFYSVYSVVQLVNGSMSNFTEAVTMYRNLSMFGGSTAISLTLPTTVTYLRLIVDASGYWFAYILVNNYFVNKKINKYMLTIIILSATSSYSLGGRNGIINIFIAIVASFFIISNKANSFKNPLKFKTVMKLVVFATIILISFESLALLIGRSGIEGESGIDYLAVYIGAPIKNLNTYLQEFHGGSFSINSQTFINFMNWAGPKLHLINSRYYLDLPFRYLGSISLGNVYTTFYAYIYDFGYMGIIFLTGFMAIFSQVFYELSKTSRKTFSPSIVSLIYAYVSSSILMSFFSNKFYEQQFNISFIKIILVWWGFEIIFCRINKKQKTINTF